MTARRGGFTLGRTALGTRYRKSHDNPLRSNIPTRSYYEILDDDDEDIDDGNVLLQNFLRTGATKKSTADDGLKDRDVKMTAFAGDVPSDQKKPIAARRESLIDDDPLRSFLNLDDISDSEASGPAPGAAVTSTVHSPAPGAAVTSTATVASRTAQTIPPIQQNNSATSTFNRNNTSQHMLTYESDDSEDMFDAGDIPPFAPAPQQSPMDRFSHKQPTSDGKPEGPISTSSSSQSHINAAIYAQHQQSVSSSFATPSKKPPSSLKTPVASQTAQSQGQSQPVPVPKSSHRPATTTTTTATTTIIKSETPRQSIPTNSIPANSFASPLPYRKKPTTTPSTAPASKPKPKSSSKPPSSSHAPHKNMPRSPSALPTRTTPASSSRRPRRNVAQPTNYFAARPGFHGYVDENGEFQDGGEVEEVQPQVPARRPTKQSEPQRPSLPPNKVAKRVPEYPIIYRTWDVSVRKELLGCDAAVTYLTQTRLKGLRRPYVDRGLRARVGQMCSSLKLEDIDDDGEVLHCDFELEEVRGTYCLIIEKKTLPPELEDPDKLRHQFSRTMKRMYPSDSEVETLARRLIQLNSLRKALAKAKTSLIQCRDEFMDVTIPASARKTIIESLTGLGAIEGTINANIGLQDLLMDIHPQVLDRICFLYPLTKALKYRNKHTLLKAFLLDVRDNALPLSPSLIRALTIELEHEEKEYRDCSIPTLLRKRDFGFGLASTQRAMRKFEQPLRPWKSFKGASGDVNKLAWSPDGARFATGAVALCGSENMHYNRDKNLLLGDLETGRLRELPDHRVPRPTSNNNIHNIAMSDYLYTTITQVFWKNDRLYTSSFDHTVKVWDAWDFDNTRCIRTLRHAHNVDVMDVSTTGAIATAIAPKSQAPSFQLWSERSDGMAIRLPLHKGSTSAPKAGMTASALKFGNLSLPDYLVGGLQGKDLDTTFDPPKDGKLYMWRLREDGPVLEFAKTMNVFDVQWHPELACFAVGSTLNQSDNGIGRDTRSMIRLFEPEESGRPVMEYMCPGLDINEVHFCPTDRHYVAASCTDGVTYVFDHRNPAKSLHSLVHGEPISDQWTNYDRGATREQGDLGIAFASWRETDELYTGSTDGVVKRWDILKAPEDVLVEDVLSLNVEITSGTFSPDYTHLLLGDTTGAIHVYSSAPVSGLDQEEEDPHFTFVEADSSHQVEKSGIEIAHESLANGELIHDAIIGVIQGPEYGKGPHTRNLFASWARPKNTDPRDMLHTPLLPDVQARQLLCPDYSKLNQAERDAMDLAVQTGIFRNRIPSQNKRKADDDDDFVLYFTTLGPEPGPNSTSGWGGSMGGIPHGLPVISLDSDDEEVDYSPFEVTNVLQKFYMPKKKKRDSVSTTTAQATDDIVMLDGVAEAQNGETSPDPAEELEEDYWWPQLDVNEIVSHAITDHDQSFE